MKRKDFEWTQAKTDALWKAGWLANASAAGVTFLATNEPASWQRFGK